MPLQYFMRRPFSRLRRAVTAWLALTLVPCTFAGDFSVNPVRVDLSAKARSGVINVVNEGKEKLSFQVQAMEWTQDAAGADRYNDTSELVFFPKIMSLEGGQDAVIRLGLKSGATSSERSFRLFIEELPSNVRKVEGQGAQVNVLIRFGVPIFAAPREPQDSLGIEALELKKGAIAFSARNTGNRHHIFKSIKLEGKDAAGQRVYGLEIADRYLLASSLKSFSAAVPADQCRQLASLQLEIQTDKLTEMRKLEVSAPMCP